MVPKTESVRERLLARLPQPENLTDYRKETEVLLAKHKKALFWEKVPSSVLSFVAVGLFLVTFTPLGSKLGTRQIQVFNAEACLFLFMSAIIDLRYRIYQNRVELLKEVKQVQLQIIELQASLNKREGAQ
jgi:hypothetical protein